MRPIDADKILEIHELETKLIGKDWTIDDLIAAIEYAPTLNVMPVIHGRPVWINPLDPGAKICMWKCSSLCSVCGDYVAADWKYCPNCGAKMDKEK